MNERSFYRETDATRPMALNCPYCRTVEDYDLQWTVRLKKDQLPQGADEQDRARFAKAGSYMVLMDDKVACKNIRCRKRFDISGIKTMAFLSADQEEVFRKQPSRDTKSPRAAGRGRGPRPGGRGPDDDNRGNRAAPAPDRGRRRKGGRGPHSRGRGAGR